MKKSLISLAVLAASGATMAQSSVQIYGRADAFLVKDKGASLQLQTGGQSSSRLGFKGEEDLGGGLKAIFKLEQGFRVQDGGAGSYWGTSKDAFSRESYVGLAGNFGQATFGKMWTAYDDVQANFGVFDANLLSPAKLVFAPYNDTAKNGIKYMSPTVNGMTGIASYALDGVSGVNQDIVSVGGIYANGPLFVAAGVQDDKLNKQKNAAINASYNLGAVTLRGAYVQTKTESVVSDKQNGVTLSMDYALAPNLTLSVAYASAKWDSENGRDSAFGLGAKYDLSKRTFLYGGFVNSNKHAADKGYAPDTRVAAGISHSF